MRFAPPAHAHAPPQPGGEVPLAELAFGEGKVERVQFQIIRLERRAVQFQESFAGYRSRALIAVQERMVAREPVRERRREIGEVRRRVAIGMELLRARQGRL